jgi:aminoglycoside N3'-acetyltransferase
MAVMDTSRQRLIEHLHELGIARGTNVVVHARLLSLGRFEGGAAGVYDALQEVVGHDATIAMPAFTLHLREHDVFDPANTAPEDVGALASYFCQLPERLRSRCPIHSYAAIGPKAAAIAASDEAQSMGPRSAFAAFKEHGFSILLLGCTFHQGATQVHQVEAEVGIPYREWMTLPRTVRDRSGEARPIKVQYYGRRANAGVQLDLAPLENELVERGYARRVSVPYGMSHFMSVVAFHEGATAMLQRDPYAFVAKTQ